MLDARVCNATNTEVTDESNFFSENSINWDAHRIGWVIAGSMTILVSHSIINLYRPISTNSALLYRPSSSQPTQSVSTQGTTIVQPNNAKSLLVTHLPIMIKTLAAINLLALN